jgi:hypothetical protein
MYRFIILLVIIITISCSDTNEKPIYQPSSSEGLTLISYVPDDSDTLFFRYPNGVLINDYNQVIINDNNNAKIFLYTNEEGLNSLISKKGRGPGELLSPRLIGLTNESIIIRDVSNSHINRYSLTGELINTFSYDEFIVNAFYNDDMIYYTSFSDQTDYLIRVMNMEGIKMSEFGKALNVEEYRTNSAVDMLSYGNDLYVFFKYYPVMRVYDQTGDLKLELIYNKNEYQAYLDKNAENIQTNNNIINYEYYFIGAEISNDKIYILRNNTSLLIEVYNLSGKILDTLSFNYDSSQQGDQYVPFDLAVKDSTIYVLENVGYPRLGIYRIR